MMDKAPDAYRTISEVAEDLDIAQHVLRFWETRFPQIKPLKRGGGRRYYRPDDVELLKGIRHLLYKEGYTIKGVQRILKDQGAKSVQAFGRPSEPIEWPDPAGAQVKTIEPGAMVGAPVELPPTPPVIPDFWPEDQGHEPVPADLHAPPPVPLPQPPATLPARPAQVANFRGGLARQMAQAKPDAGQLPLLAGAEPGEPEAAGSAAPPATPMAQADRRTQLLAALDDIEACRALVAAARAARPR